MNTDKEEQLTKKRLLELAQTAEQKGIDLYSDFLSLSEQSLFQELIGKLPPILYTFCGGVKEAERVCVGFLGSQPVIKAQEKMFFPDEEADFPIVCLKISVTDARYSERLTHRDYLGALLHLGISRSKLGDLYVKEEGAYLFCMASMKGFLCNELLQVKHTPVHCEEVIPDKETLAPTLHEFSGTVPSLRLDAILATAFSTSRSSLLAYIEAGKVFINGRLATKPGAAVEEEDLLTVRGLGKAKLARINNTTKKGRISVLIQKYVS